ncbi:MULTISPECIES: hypothetical protein [unclassified Chryseobacterium]|uniref:hypothetical protein n=1 Tax=unclassified Chryseobacterium TaxID=2593645 RepID=UPI000D39A555|nr:MULTISPECIES: hypothetical protein [unclassified Chryseobacterium]PTT68878.1 hypothetical protein DBR25_19735 [Chryseobacterium sp. HMWF001]PVV53537.1 hypothetical protein DD829_18695 [Chryseobacterium sp. HMWF035]
MKKFILGAFATLMISGSALAATTSNSENVPSVNTATTELKESFNFDSTAARRLCIITVKTTYADGSVKIQTFPFEVDGGDDPTLAQAQCGAIKAAFIAGLNL